MNSLWVLSLLYLFIWVFVNWAYAKNNPSTVGRPTGQRIFFWSGSLIWLICVSNPIAQLGATKLPLHVMNQLVITMVAMPLIVLGSPKFGFEFLGTFRKVKEAILHPIVSWTIFVAVLIAAYTPAVVGWNHDNQIAASLFQAFVLPATSAIYFYPILKSEQDNFAYALRIMSLFFMMIPETMIGFFIYIQNRIIYPEYLGHGEFESMLSQQQLAGALMWSISMIVDSIWIAIAVQRWFKSEKIKGEKIKAEIIAEQKLII